MSSPGSAAEAEISKKGSIQMQIVPAPKSKEPSVYEAMTWLERKRDKFTKSKSEYAHWNKSYEKALATA